MCSENIVADSSLDMNCAEIDKTMIKDPRVVKNLLELERSTVIKFDYFKQIQEEITPYMRGVVASWMMEVRSIVLIFFFFLIIIHQIPN